MKNSPHHNARYADRQQRRSHKGGALEGDGIDRTGSTGQQNQPANQRTKRNRGGTRLHDQVNAQHNADQRHQNQFPTDLFHKSSPSLWIAWADVRCAMQGAPAFYLYYITWACLRHPCGAGEERYPAGQFHCFVWKFCFRPLPAPKDRRLRWVPAAARFPACG